MDVREDLLYIVDLLHSTKRKQWHIILKKLTKVFGAEEALIVELNKDKAFCVLSSSSRTVNRRIIGNDPVSLSTVRSKAVIHISDYQSSKLSMPYWKKRNLKSIISLPLWYGDEVFGALQLLNFSHTREFSNTEIELLRRICKVISLAMMLEKTRESHGKTIAIETNQMKLIYGGRIPSGYKNREFSRWIKSYLLKLLKTIDAEAAGFIAPKENIYVAISRKNRKTNIISYSVDERVKNLISYRLYTEGIKEMKLLKDIRKINMPLSDFIKENGIQSAAFLPVVANNETVAIFSLGFREKNKPTKSYQLFMNTVAVYLLFIIDTCKNLHSVNSLLSDMEENFIESFVLMMEARDIYTKGHSQRVALYAKYIAQSLGLPRYEVDSLYTAGILHDIGKMGIPDAVLLKPRKLSEEEFKIMQYHPEFSYQIIKNISRFEEIALYVRYHHERCDGSGYPEGLKCPEIPLGARILAVADVFDAVTTDRPYRKALSPNEAVSMLISSEQLFGKDLIKHSIGALKKGFLSAEIAEKESRGFMPEEIDRIRREIFTKDFMTGLLGLRSFMERLSEKISAQEPFTLFRVDIKDLSSINHRYSMELGDRIIMFTAQALKGISNIELRARVQADVFYFTYSGTENLIEFSSHIKETLKLFVIKKLSDLELDLQTWEKMIDFYITFSEYAPGKFPEDLMYECQQLKKRIKAVAGGKDVSQHYNRLF